MSLGTAALDVALGYVGVGEEKGNNQGQWVKLFCGTENVSWCAGFVGFCLASGVIALKVAPIKRSLGARKLAENLLEYPGAVMVKRSFEPGDVVVWSRTGPGTTPRSGHIGIVLMSLRRGFLSVEGNVGSYSTTRGMVRPIFHKHNEPNLLYGVRLP